MKQRTLPPEPGNTGEWYLGIVHTSSPPDVRAPSHFEELPAPNGLPATQLSVHDIPDRSYRITPLAIAALLLFALVGGTIWLVRQPTVRAQAMEVRYDAAVMDLAGSLPALESAAVVVTTLTATPDDIRQAADIAAAYAVFAIDASALASETVATLPLVSTDAVDALEPKKRDIAVAAPEAAGLAGAVIDIAEYRRVADSVIQLPDLVVEADPDSIAELSVALASTLADAAGDLGALPIVTEMSRHRQELTASVTRFGDWQVEYLDALRRGDTEAASVLVAEWDTIELRLRRQLMSGLDVAAARLLDEMADLRTALEAIPAA